MIAGQPPSRGRPGKGGEGNVIRNRMPAFYCAVVLCLWTPAAASAQVCADQDLVLVFRHDLSGGFFANDDEAASVNAASQNPAAETKFSRLSELEGMRGDDGAFHFKLHYPGDPAYGNGFNEWKQTSNPVESPTVEGYQPIDITWTSEYWGGLVKSSDPRTFVEGSVDHPWWFYSIGSNTEWNGAIPGPLNSTPVQVVELYACAPSAPSLVQATTLDNGQEVVLGELLDTNGDQIPSPGDTAKVYKFPNGFNGGDYDTSLGMLECTIVHADDQPGQRRLQVKFDRRDCSIDLIYWTNREAIHEPTQIHERFGFWVDNQAVKVDLCDSETFVRKDWVRVNDVSRVERPSSSSTDDPWLTVQFNY